MWSGNGKRRPSKATAAITRTSNTMRHKSVIQRATWTHGNKGLFACQQFPPHNTVRVHIGFLIVHLKRKNPNINISQFTRGTSSRSISGAHHWGVPTRVMCCVTSLVRLTPRSHNCTISIEFLTRKFEKNRYNFQWKNFH